jgi:hypothetical protein
MNDEKKSAQTALESLGISVEEMQKTEEDLEKQGLKRYRYTDSRICLCGHGVGRHTVTNGVVYCKPSRMECPCKKLRPVLEAGDTRLFIRKTSGSGPLHALTLGLLSLIKAGKTAEWVVELECDRCKKKTGDVVPVPVTQYGKAATYATGYDALLCPDCRREI